MAKNLTQKIIFAHLLAGKMAPSEEIALKIDHTLLQDATGTMAMLEFEALGVDRVYPHASAAERSDLVDYHLDKVGLGAAMHRRAADLSNGMKQRVGIARAFALSPKLLLLDEPFGMLDTLTRWELQEVLMEVWSRTQVTAIVVTHDVDEAILLADRVVMMTNGPAATIGEVLSVDLPRPRQRVELAESAEYQRYRKAVIDFLYTRQAHVEKTA